MREIEQIDRFIILVAEDDPDDRFLMNEAFRETGGNAGLRFVEDGEELMQYLHQSARHVDTERFPFPSLIFLDLNMPKKDGRQALREIKTDFDLKGIPVVIWTTSSARQDKIQCQREGADIYITKPSGYFDLVENIREIVVKYSLKENEAIAV